MLTSLLDTTEAPSGSATAAVLDTKQASTLVRVRDVSTVVLGGRIQTQKVKNDRKIPLLVLGRAIKRSSVAPRRRLNSGPIRGLKPTAIITASLRDAARLRRAAWAVGPHTDPRSRTAQHGGRTTKFFVSFVSLV